MLDIQAKQKIEIEFWRNSKDESPESDSIHNVVDKMADAEVFLDCLTRHQDKFINSGRALELGSGQG